MITRRWQKDDKNQARIIKRVKTQQICCYEIHQYYVKYMLNINIIIYYIELVLSSTTIRIYPYIYLVFKFLSQANIKIAKLANENKNEYFYY